MLPKITPHATSPGHTAIVSFQLLSTRISQNGRIKVVSGKMRPSIALKSASGRPVTATSVRTGFPNAPYATGDEFAIRHITAVWNGGNPRPIIMAPVIATGAPPPPAPSSSAPNANATSSTCNRRSPEISPTDCFTILNLPDSTESSYTKTAATTIHAIRNQPNTSPLATAPATIT